MPKLLLGVTLLSIALLITSVSAANDTKNPTASVPSACVLDTLSSSLAALSPDMNQVLQYIRNLDPRLVSLEISPRWEDLENLKIAIDQLKRAKSDLASKGRLDEARKWAIEAENALKTDPRLSAIAKLDTGVRPVSEYKPNELALRRLYSKLLYALDQELPPNLRVPLKRLPYDQRASKLLAEARKLVAEQEKLFDSFFLTTGFSDETSFRAALNSMGGGYTKLLDALDHDQFEFAMNLQEDLRGRVSKLGILNQHVTKTSMAMLDSRVRNVNEGKFVGKLYSQYKDLDPELKPKYGYLKPTPEFGLTQNKGAYQYGDDVYVFKKDRVKDRITWLPGDSLVRAQYTGATNEAIVTKTWEGFFVPWKDRSLLVPFVYPKMEYQKVGFEPGTSLPKEISLSVLPRPIPPSSQMVLPKPAEPTFPPMPSVPAEASNYALLTTPHYSDEPVIIKSPSDLRLDPGAPSTAQEAFRKWQDDFKAAMTGPEYKKYEAELSAYHQTELQAWKASKDAFDKAMSDFYNSDSYKAWKESSENYDKTVRALTVDRFKGTPLEPFKFHDADRYVELHFFGPLTLDDVEVFEFRKNPPTGEFLEDLKKRKIKIRDGRKEPAADWNEGTP
jgi:hypothetical protein